MKYATWSLYWEPDIHYGTGPEPVIAERGGAATGLFFMGDTPQSVIVGEVQGDVPLNDLTEWNVQEITSTEALGYAQERDEGAVLNEQGQIVFSPPEPGFAA